MTSPTDRRSQKMAKFVTKDGEICFHYTVFRIVKRGQLELTGGAWVMTDEATPYFWATIDNIIEGHQFLHQNLGATPETSWSVDPFGHGVTLSYLMGLASIRKLVIGRVHMQIKAQLTKARNLIFNWRQSWGKKTVKSPLKYVSRIFFFFVFPYILRCRFTLDESNETDVLVHVLYGMGYYTASGCGPDEKVCCQFDFGPSSPSRCNQPMIINGKNVKH